ncbi:MAG: DMT family transporter [Desulfomicrobium sp.]
MINAPFAGEIAALAAAFIWAVATMIYARTGNRAPALFLNLVKGTIAVAMLSLTVLILGETCPDLTVSQWLWLTGSGIVGISVGDSAYFSAIKRVGPSQTLLVESLAPPLTGVLALCFLDEAIGFWAWTGIFLTMAGILWVVTEHRPQQKRIHLPGLGFATLAALCQAGGMVMSRQVMVTTDITPLWAALIRLGAASVVLWTALPVLRPDIVLRRDSWRAVGTARNGWAFFVLAVFLGTFLGIWLQQAALKLTGAAIAQTLLSVSPLFALGLAAMSGHKVSRRSFAGALLTLAGVALFFR